jgi:dihydroflavonol-4-reductase
MYGHDRARTAPFTAADWTALESKDINFYLESKTRAERAAWEIAARLGRTSHLVAINPANIYGPLLDDDPGTSATLVIRLLDGSLPAVARLSLPSIDVRDVAALHVQAMTHPDAGGRRFPMAESNLTLLDMAAALRPHVPRHARRLPRFAVPDWLVRVFARLDADMAGNIAELGPPRRVDASAARALLGRPFIPAAEAAIATARTAIEQRLI